MSLPPMGVTIYGRPQGNSNPHATASLELTVHHPNGSRAVHRIGLWDHGDQLAHDAVHNGDRTARGMLADWADENKEHFHHVPDEYKPYIGQLIRRGHRYPPEPPVQMSRDKPKPLVVSYDKNHRRFSLNKKYAASTISQVMGRGDYGKEMLPHMVGSRLAVVLREIKHSVSGDNQRLQKLTSNALAGNVHPKLYEAIRDELFRSKNPRAVQLARQYNWHKVGEGLERDRHLRDFVINASKGTVHEGHHQMLRRFYNGVVHGKGGPDDRTRGAFYQAMRQHLQERTGKAHSDQDIQDSLRRLGDTEENIEKINNLGKAGNAKFELPDYEHPAYTGVPKEGHFPPKKQVAPIEKRAPGQFKRRNTMRFKK